MTDRVPLLDVSDVTIRFGDFVAVNRVSLQVEAGETVGLIGPNGSGKTTLVNAISGFAPTQAGRIVFREKRIQQLKPFEIARLGIARTFQRPRIFPGMTPFEHCESARSAVEHQRLSAMINAGCRRAAADPELAFLISSLFGGTVSGLRSAALAHGHRRLLEVARALAGLPTLLLLDEPTSGLSDDESAELIRLIRKSQKQRHFSALIIDHRFHFLRNLCDRVIVLDAGRKIAEGPPMAVEHDPAVVAAYFG